MKEGDILINIYNNKEYKLIEEKKKTVVVERDCNIHVIAKSDMKEKE